MILFGRNLDSTHALSSAEVVGIGTSGSVFLLTILGLCVSLYCRVQHNRRLATLERSTTPSRHTSHPVPSVKVVASPNVTSKRSNHGDSFWEKSSPKEGDPNRRWRTRDSTAPLRASVSSKLIPPERATLLRQLSWKKSGNQKLSFSGATDKYLSIITESPMSQDDSPVLSSKVSPERRTGIPHPTVHDRISSNQPVRSLTSDGNGFPNTSTPAAFEPTLARRDERSRFAHQAEKSHSVPSLPLTQNTTVVLSEQKTNPKAHGHSRSLSLGHSPPTSAPQNPLPPVPSRLSTSVKRSKIVRQVSSRETLSSEMSDNSSILTKTLPTSETGPQVLAGRSLDASLQLEQRPGLDSHDTTLEASTEAGEHDKTDDSGVEILRSRQSPINNSPSIGKHSDGPVRNRHLAQTNRKPPIGTQNVSMSGSPLERRRSTTPYDVVDSRASLLRQISESSTQLSSARSSIHNPFSWDPTYVTQPSALKGSPRARRHGRTQTAVHVSFLCPLPDSPSRPNHAFYTPSIAKGLRYDNFEGTVPPDSLSFKPPRPSSFGSKIENSSNSQWDTANNASSLQASIEPYVDCPVKVTRHDRHSDSARSAAEEQARSNSATRCSFNQKPHRPCSLGEKNGQEYAPQMDTRTNDLGDEELLVTVSGDEDLVSKRRAAFSDNRSLAFPQINPQPSIYKTKERQMDASVLPSSKSSSSSSATASERRQPSSSSCYISMSNVDPKSSYLSDLPLPSPTRQKPLSSHLQSADDLPDHSIPPTQMTCQAFTSIPQSLEHEQRYPLNDSVHGLEALAQQLRREKSEVEIIESLKARPYSHFDNPSQRLSTTSSLQRFDFGLSRDNSVSLQSRSNIPTMGENATRIANDMQMYGSGSAGSEAAVFGRHSTVAGSVGRPVSMYRFGSDRDGSEYGESLIGPFGLNEDDRIHSDNESLASTTLNSVYDADGFLRYGY